MTPKQTYYETLSKTIIKNLEKRNMEGFYCPDSESAVKKAMSLMPEHSVISWGGSMSLVETGLIDTLKNSNHTLIDRLTAKTPEEKKALYGKIVCSDYYFMSTNAITLEGELVNIDGFGNRVACLIAGPENVIIIAGMNKITTDVEEGINRTRNIAAPPNCVRLDKKTPCASTGRCGDCYSPDSICSQIVITRRSGIQGRIKVILVGEELGY
ncbi:lactate utilization protein [Anaerosacchariphilus polymeriproducens]|uniref:Lactate utilization protein n=1 Tax=Anaerosacchariphilus polymeriproducens TaxID=1812858 RepID=A0A371AWP5_9FIRM|nr:lactate utilization protein [Anaerosacchariphilus polymeriproducens]RDU23959.1 lactate utilization protein [Anaerosacchariphilus polymeriproducens]